MANNVSINLHLEEIEAKWLSDLLKERKDFFRKKMKTIANVSSSSASYATKSTDLMQAAAECDLCESLLRKVMGDKTK